MRKLLVVVAIVGMLITGCDDPRTEGGSEANAEKGMEAIIETQGTINRAADAVWEAADEAAEALSIAPDGSVAEAIGDSSPHLLEQAATLAKRIVKYDACMKDCAESDTGCEANCRILFK